MATDPHDPSAGRTMEYQPALDGLRAVAVSMVLLFHGGVAWMGGGYVGVSVFFTLSGYLITTLLLVEHDRTGRISPAVFYARRAKRLLPASLLCLGSVTIAASFGAFGGFPNLRRDLLGSLFQVQNWVKLAGDASYADLTNASLGRLAPLEHYWSLAIEEQFYWLWPVVMILVLRHTRDARSRAGALIAIAMCGMLVAPVIAGVWGADAAYWATPARMGEILVGAAVAGWLHWRPVETDRARWLAPVGIAVVTWAAVTWPTAGGPAYAGWLPVFALATGALIIGLQRRSWTLAMLSARPVVWIGGISYGLYLYHWPLFALIDESSTGWNGTALLTLRLSATAVTAALSARLLERPVRAWSPQRLRPLLGGALATGVLAALIVVAVDPVTADRVDVAGEGLDEVSGTLAPLVIVAPTTTSATTTSPSRTTNPSTTAPAPSTTTTTPTPSTTTTTPTPSTTTPPFGVTSLGVPIPTTSRELRLVVIGDSTAEMTSVGIANWTLAHPGRLQIDSLATPGCGFLREGHVPTDLDTGWDDNCTRALDDELPATIAALQPDVVMLMVTMRDVEDRTFPGIPIPISPLDQRFAVKLLDAYESMAEQLLAAGIGHLAWVIAPPPISDFQGTQVKMLDRHRYEVQWDIIRQVAAQHPDEISVLDADAWLRAVGEDRSADVRVDGLHWSESAAVWVSDQFFVGSLIDAVLS